MKRAARVLGSYLLLGVILYMFSTQMRDESPLKDWTWFLGMISMSVPGMLLVGMALILPHELAHIYVGKRLGFGLSSLQVLGFKYFKFDGHPFLRWRFDLFPLVARSQYKKDATTNEIRLLFLAGPVASFLMAVLFSPLILIDETKQFGQLAVIANLLYCLGSIIGSGDGPSDYYYIKSLRVQADSMKHYYRRQFETHAEWNRKRNSSMDKFKLNGRPSNDLEICLNTYWILMDAGKVAEAEPHIRKGLEIVQRHQFKDKLFGECCYEAAVYFRRFRPDSVLAKLADELCNKIDPDNPKSEIVVGAQLWQDGNREAAISHWEAFHDNWKKGKTDPGTLNHGRDWFIRLRREDMVFETDRLFARYWTLEDTQACLEIYGNPEVMRFLGRNPKVIENLEEAKELIESWIAKESARPHGQGGWAIVRKEDEHVIGTIMCKALPNNEMEPSGELEIGWHLGQEYWGMGYATEAAKAVVEYGFKMDPNLQRVLAIVYPDNKASKRVTEKLGMTYLGVSNDYYNVQLDLYELKRPE